MSTPPLIAVCLPSYGEEATIGAVATAVAEGLRGLGDRARVTLVHVDCGSPDRTVERFAALRLPVPTVQRTAARGKGSALRAFFAVCRELDARYALSFDTDLTAITPRWVARFAEPLLSGRAGAVLPSYPRSVYEASATNHLAVPVVYACTGRLVPQPIGGEFGIDLRAVAPERVEWTGSTLHFGVDIALTFEMLRDAGRIGLVDPGVKRHKPSFFHLEEVFGQVAESALRLAGSVRFPGSAAPLTTPGPVRLWRGEWTHRRESRALFDRARETLTASGTAVPGWDDPALPGWAADAWAPALARELRAAREGAARPAEGARALAPLFAVRATSFWLAADREGLGPAEQALVDQAERVRRLLLPVRTG
ncbi:glycosyltransferase [Streptantibioticus parmotrematis]|uniref:glycosyltransferase n=1 Tax=Streptantibioticus parmotrematis TaxID=2873249 RepID=UPI00340A3ECB